MNNISCHFNTRNGRKWRERQRHWKTKTKNTTEKAFKLVKIKSFCKSHLFKNRHTASVAVCKFNRDYELPRWFFFSVNIAAGAVAWEKNIRTKQQIWCQAQFNLMTVWTLLLVKCSNESDVVNKMCCFKSVDDNNPLVSHFNFIHGFSFEFV